MHANRTPAGVSFFRFLPLLLLLLRPAAASAQYVFLDANGDGQNDSSDQLNATGPTDLDVWFVTDQNRDGSPAVCTTDPTQLLTINSYEFVLLAKNGTIRFGPMVNRLPYTGTPTSFAGYEDTTNTSVYHNGWGYRDIFAPGRYRVATLRVEIASGTPSLVFAGRSPIQGVDLTSFGTKCEGVDFDNTYVLGEEFLDASGIGSLIAEAGGPYYGLATSNVYFSGTHSLNPSGDPMNYAWDFGDGQTATGVSPVHAYAQAGTYTATLTVSAGSSSATDQAAVTIVDGTANTASPIANVGGPYHGRPGVPVGFDASLSYDPHGAGLVYSWDFGDQRQATGQKPVHTYDAAGVYTVHLDVFDGTNHATDETVCTIDEPILNHAPTASAGGPYDGIVGRWIQFNATASSDPDGDPLSIAWEFGDNTQGVGPVAAHAYRLAGTYTVRAFASDGSLTNAATTQATVTASFGMEVFLDGGKTVVNLDADDDVLVRFQPANGSFQSVDVDPDRVDLSLELPDGRVAPVGGSGSAVEASDQNGDGVPEFTVTFSRAALADLVDAEDLHGRTRLVLAVGLHRGGDAVGEFGATFTHGNGPHLTITPNPFNPAAVVIIRTTRAGEVSAKLYDVRGRLMRTVLTHQHLTAGRHDFPLEATDDRGIHLSSGVYFLQVNGPDGAKTGRVVVAK